MQEVDFGQQIITAIVAIAVGVGGMMAYYFFSNLAIDRFLSDDARRRVRPWLLVGPALLILLIYLVYPAINTIILSFYDKTGDNFVGLQNFGWAFGWVGDILNPAEGKDLNTVWQGNAMLQSFVNNIIWLLFVPFFSTASGLVIAVLADRVRWESLAKAIIFMPMAISFVGASVIWKFVYAFQPLGEPQIGILNAIKVPLGGDPIGWATDVGAPFNTFALLTILIWIQTGFAMVLLSAALKGVPEETIEAARIDGASEIQIFFRVLIPQIMSTIVVVMTTIIILVLKVFDIVFVMTSGRFQTEVLGNRMFVEFFINREFGQGATVAVIIMVAVLPVMWWNIRRFQQEGNMK